MVKKNDESDFFKFYDEWLAIARQHGYDTVSPAIKHFHEAGNTSRQIGDIFNVTPSTIRYHLVRLGVTPRHRGGRNNARRNDAYFVGETPLAEWCNKRNVNIERILQRLRRGWSMHRATTQPLLKRRTP